MRKDIEFKAGDGTILRGWHYVPGSGAGKYPTIVMAHGYSAVKEMYLDAFAEHFAEVGKRLRVRKFLRGAREGVRVHVAERDDFIVLRRRIEIALAFAPAADGGDAELFAGGRFVCAEQEIGQNDAASSGDGETFEEGTTGGAEWVHGVMGGGLVRRVPCLGKTGDRADA